LRIPDQTLHPILAQTLYPLPG